MWKRSETALHRLRARTPQPCSRRRDRSRLTRWPRRRHRAAATAPPARPSSRSHSRPVSRFTKPVMNRPGRRNVVSSPPVAGQEPPAAAPALRGRRGHSSPCGPPRHPMISSQRDSRAVSGSTSDRSPQPAREPSPRWHLSRRLVKVPHPGVSHRNRRFNQHRIVRRRKLKPSRTRWVRRCFTRALNTPQLGHGASDRATCTVTTARRHQSRPRRAPRTPQDRPAHAQGQPPRASLSRLRYSQTCEAPRRERGPTRSAALPHQLPRAG